MTTQEAGKLVVVSGPSGVGKSTVVREVLKRFSSRLRLSVSATTRPPRPGEQHGIDYHFLSDREFAERRQAGQFLECIEVFGQGNWYGTLWSEVRPSLEAGKWVILEIDVDGAQRVLQQFPAAATLFICPESWEELQRRLRGRDTETEAAIEHRLAVAKREMQHAENYEFQVVNVTVEQAVDEICQILQSRGLSYD